MPIVLVTGAGGFIGSHLTESLASTGHNVRALLHYNSRSDLAELSQASSAVLSQVEVRFGDITDPHYTREVVEGCDLVIHLAALIGIPYSYQAPASYLAVNAHGTLNVLEACRQARVPRVVVTSTSEVYGTARVTPISEEHPLQGQSPYSASKIAAEKMAQAYYCTYGLPVTVVRPFNTYGPRQSARAIIPTIATQILAGLPEIRLGALWPERDLTYVTDTVQGLIAVAACEAAVGEVVNLGSGRKVSIGQLADTLLRLSGREVPVVSVNDRLRPDRSEVGLLLADTSKVRRLTGWEPQVPLAEGLDRVLAYVRANPGRYRPSEYQR